MTGWELFNDGFLPGAIGGIIGSLIQMNWAKIKKALRFRKDKVR